MSLQETKFIKKSLYIFQYIFAKQKFQIHLNIQLEVLKAFLEKFLKGFVGSSNGLYKKFNISIWSICLFLKFTKDVMTKAKKFAEYTGNFKNKNTKNQTRKISIFLKFFNQFFIRKLKSTY